MRNVGSCSHFGPNFKILCAISRDTKILGLIYYQLVSVGNDCQLQSHKKFSSASKINFIIAIQSGYSELRGSNKNFLYLWQVTNILALLMSMAKGEVIKMLMLECVVSKICQFNGSREILKKLTESTQFTHTLIRTYILLFVYISQFDAVKNQRFRKSCDDSLKQTECAPGWTFDLYSDSKLMLSYCTSYVHECVCVFVCVLLGDNTVPQSEQQITNDRTEQTPAQRQPLIKLGQGQRGADS